MYSGKHVAKEKSPNKGYLRTFLTWGLMVFLIVGAMSFSYAKFLEGRVHEAIGGGEDEIIKLKPRTENEPVTFLILGSDIREDEEIGRSDTIMILRVSPEKKIAYLVSIPRDTRVKIPDHGTRKINAAYQLGGSSLTIKTIEDFTGFQINHYAVVDFEGFKEIIDAIGGIDIDVEKRMYDPRLGNKIDLHPGYQHLNGRKALGYVRFRRTDDDFHRIERQQKFIKAVTEKMMQLSTILRIPQIAEIASRNFRTDSGLGITQMVAYGQMLKSIGKKNLHTTMIPGTPQMIGGASYVVADEEKTAWMFERIKNDMPLEITEEEKQNADIKVDVWNGSGGFGTAKKMAAKLAALNFNIRNVTNAQSFGYNETQVVTTEENAKLADKVQSQLGFGRLVIDEGISISTDVLVIAGRDFDDMIGNTDREEEQN